MSTELKLCYKCKEWKPRTLEYFYRRATASDGLRSECKVCGASAGKAYFKTYYAKRADELRDYQAQYRKEQPEKLKARKRTYRERNADKVAAGLRLWRMTHVALRRKFSLDWQRANPDKVARSRMRRRARKKGAQGTHTTQEWRDLCTRYGNKCLACGASGNLTEDHVIPLLLGGSDDISNIQPLCHPCNARKGIKTTDYRGRPMLFQLISARSIRR